MSKSGKSFVNQTALRIVAILAISIFTLPALAQDGAPTSHEAARWIGFYVGGHAGIGTADFDSVFDLDEITQGWPEDAVVGRFFELDSGLAGVHIGFNRSSGRLVYGIEADWSHFRVSDRLFDPDDEGPGTTDSASAAINWVASVRGRLGFASAQTLIYLTAGIAWVDAKYTAIDADNGAPDQGSADVSGLGIVVGGGLEHAITRQIALRFEALYYSFRDKVDTSALNVDSAVGDYANVSDIVVARIGVSYQLTQAPSAAHETPRPAAWTGVYAGGHLGFGHVGFDSLFDAAEILRGLDVEDSVLGRYFDLDGVVGGGHVGFNQALGRFVLGIEAGWSYLGQSDHLSDPQPDFPGTDNASVDMNWLASLRGRIGITSARTLLYATAGVAWVDGTYTAQNADNFNVNQGSASLSATGFVWGGGIEHALSDTILLRIEGLQYSFNSRIDTSGLTTDSDPGDFATIGDITVVRVGASYKFNFGAN